MGCDKGKDKEFTGANFDELYTPEEAVAADEMLQTDEWIGTVDMLDDCEAEFAAMENARDLLADLLADVRKLDDEQRKQLRNRSLQSLTDALIDHRRQDQKP